ncbi:hypothetical protein DSO57_1003590 [Entomophthora muscae]|uniref:Uncharacterized protein n=1 Tax=Entomophthora muscae TaxID=34485 RepID=A0ACC2TVE5_9FUNG|nr:hypothetical protein DSO57_1003590 [Entomophthora muscae]
MTKQHAPDNFCSLNKPIRPRNAIKTNTPNVLYNNCNSDGSIRTSAAGANYTHTAQTGCPIPSQPINACTPKKFNAHTSKPRNNNFSQPIEFNLPMETGTFSTPSKPQANQFR